MTKQAGLYHEMATTLTQLSEGKETISGLKILKAQVSAFRDLRAKTAALPNPSEDEVLQLSQLDGQQEARDAFFKAQSALHNSEQLSTQILDILSGLHDSVSVKGEGNL